MRSRKQLKSASRQYSVSDSEGEKLLLERNGIWGWDAEVERRWTIRREAELRKGLSPNAAKADRATVFVSLPSRTMVFVGSFFALTTILGTIATCLLNDNDLQGLVYPFISETAREWPQNGAFGFGMTVSCMFMISCAILQYGKVKRDIGPGGVGSKRNLGALIAGIIAPPFLGLLGCYDTLRAPGTHRFCVVVFFSLTCGYMLTIVSIYSHLAGLSVLAERELAMQGEPTSYRSSRRCSASATEIKNVRFSVKVKQLLTTLFFGFSFFYLAVGPYMCQDMFADKYHEDDVMIHAARAAGQHCAVICIILFYGTFYYDFGDLNLYLVTR